VAKTTRVPKETYNIAAWVQEPGSGAQTLVEGADSSGFTASVTVINAYAVS